MTTDLKPHKYDPFNRCSTCGFCYDFCPAYSISGDDTQSVDSERILFNGCPENRSEFFKVENRLSTCLLCKACFPSCSTGRMPDEVILSIREQMVESHGMSMMHRIFFKGILPYPRRMDIAVRYIPLIKKLGLMRLAKAINLDAAGLRLADAIRASTPKGSGKTTLLNNTASETRKTITYFRSCGFDHVLPEVRSATLNILSSMGYDIVLSSNYCCGLPSYANGDTRTARDLAKKNIRLLEGSEFILTECASCSSFLKKYSDLFADEPEHALTAKRFAERVKDSHELLCHDLSLAQQSPARDVSRNVKVTYHDPCHLNRYQGITEEPRKIISAIPGIEYVELPESDWCCGGPGLYSVMNNEISIKILKRKIRNIEKTQADIVATSCPACIIQLSDGMSRAGLKVDVMHVNQLVAQFIDSAEHGDFLKKRRPGQETDAYTGAATISC